jgi:hypothetical protein
VFELSPSASTHLHYFRYPLDMATKVFPYSSFLRGPSDVLPSLEEGDVVLERRDDESLVVTRHDRYEARLFGMGVAARVLVHLVNEDPERATRLIADEMPWLTWLPDDERATCVQQLLTNLAAGADTGTLEPFARAVTEWRDTAEVWADPELANRFRTGFPGDGPELRHPVEV